LDEIAETSLECQARLLRFLEAGEVHAVGDVLPKKVSVRVIAATNRRLEELRSVGVMRPDLFYRLSVLRIEIPALRHRKAEILPIAEDSLAEFARQFGKAPLTLSADCREALICCDWPGNVRQLMNEIRCAAALANAGGTITSRDLSEDVGGSSSTSMSGPPQPHVEISLNQPLSNATEELERASITHAIRLCDGRREQVAALLGLSRKGLYLKCLRLGLEAESRADRPLGDDRNEHPTCQK
jgi:DNA-binding NtrC family response regulator